MAILNEIRKKSILLMVFIGVAMLAFVLGSGLKNRQHSQSFTNLGEIFGEEINVEEYEKRVDYMAQQQEQQGADVNREQIRQQVWFTMISELVMSKEFDALGITVCPEELSDMIYGNNVHPEVKNIPFFKDSLTQTYSKQVAINIRKNVDNNPMLKSWWTSFEQNLKQLRGVEEFNNLVQKGLYATASQGQFDFISNNKKVSFQFIVSPYASIVDSAAVFTEADVKAKYESIKDNKQYEQQESRDIEYIEFPIVASDVDKKYTLNLLTEDLIEQFKLAKNDSAFVVNKSDSKKFDENYYHSGDFIGAADTLIFHADSGDIVGPYFDEQNNSYNITKIRESTLEEVASVRHILLKTGQGEDEAVVKTRADSIVKAIKKGADFEEMVNKFSGDPGSIPNGGRYDKFPRGQMVTEFEDFSFDKPIGSLGIVKTQFGFHIIEVLERSTGKKVKVATVDMKVRPGKATKDGVYKQALTFALKNNTPEAFNASAEKQGLNILQAEKLTTDMRTIPGVESAPSVVKWAYNSELNAVSPQPLELSDRVVVCHLTKIRNEGVPSLEDLRVLIEPMVIKEKKAAMLMAKMQGTTLTEIANTTGDSIMTQNDITFATTAIAGAGGNEPTVIGTVMAMATKGSKGIVSHPIKGEKGVYVVLLTNITDAPEKADFSSEKITLTQNYRSQLSGNNFYQTALYRALEEKADFKDYRKKVELLRN